MKKSLIHQISNSDGFTIVEVIISLLIGFTTIMGFVFAFTYGSELVYRSSLKEQALGYMQGEMEKITLLSNYGENDISLLERKQDIKLYHHYENNSSYNIKAKLETTISEITEGEDFIYRDVDIHTIMELESEGKSYKDTLTLTRRIYSEPE